MSLLQKWLPFVSSRGAKRRGDLFSTACEPLLRLLRCARNDTKGVFSFIVACSSGDNCECESRGNLMLIINRNVCRKAGVLAGSFRYSSPATHRQTLSAKGTARNSGNSVSMHSVLAARNILFLAPLRSPQLRRGLPRLVVGHSPG